MEQEINSSIQIFIYESNKRMGNFYRYGNNAVHILIVFTDMDHRIDSPVKIYLYESNKYIWNSARYVYNAVHVLIIRFGPNSRDVEHKIKKPCMLQEGLTSVTLQMVLYWLWSRFVLLLYLQL